jgi:TRAP-type mannitol/chloroaromatic compound transport system permease small subunit
MAKTSTEAGMAGLARWIGRIERLNARIGEAVSWLTVLIVVTAFAVVVLRYGFGWGRVWLQEAYVWLHGLVLMLAAAWTLGTDGHVRLDLLYRPASARTKAWLDLAGALLLLLPFVIVVALASLPYVANSWAVWERSHEPGGMPGLFLLKSVLLLLSLLLGLQGLAVAGKSLLVVLGRADAR